MRTCDQAPNVRDVSTTPSQGRLSQSEPIRDFDHRVVSWFTARYSMRSTDVGLQRYGIAAAEVASLTECHMNYGDQLLMHILSMTGSRTWRQGTNMPSQRPNAPLPDMSVHPVVFRPDLLYGIPKSWLCTILLLGETSACRMQKVPHRSRSLFDVKMTWFLYDTPYLWRLANMASYNNGSHRYPQ